MGKIGTTELLVVLAIVLVIFGPKALPKLGRSLGKTLGIPMGNSYAPRLREAGLTLSPPATTTVAQPVSEAAPGRSLIERI